MADEYLSPPEETPDEAMAAAREEATAEAQKLEAAPPEEGQDFGMAAGYPPTSELPEDPGAAKAEMEKPPEEAARGAPLFSHLALEIPGLEPQTPAPQQKEALDADPEMLNLLVSDDDLRELWQRADVAQGMINQEIHSIEIGRQMLNHIRDGRNELLAGRDHYEEAERFINEVDFRVQLSRLVRKWTKQWGWWLFLYQILVGIVLLGLIITQFGSFAFAGAKEINLSQVTPTPTAVTGQAESENEPAPTPTPAVVVGRSGAKWVRGMGPDMIYLMVTMLWGGIGGVVGALTSLIQHTSIDQDFDKQHKMWYFGSPWVGVALGASVFLLTRAGLLSLIDSSTDIQSPIIIYVLGFLCGYRQNVFTELIKRVLNAFRFEETAPTTPPPQPKQGNGSNPQAPLTTPAPQKTPEGESNNS